MSAAAAISTPAAELREKWVAEMRRELAQALFPAVQIEAAAEALARDYYDYAGPGTYSPREAIEEDFTL